MGDNLRDKAKKKMHQMENKAHEMKGKADQKAKDMGQDTKHPMP